MLRWLRHRASDRKMRPFGCACCRLVWPLLTHEESRQAVRTSERFADGLATAEELRDSQGGARVAYHEARIALDTERASTGKPRPDSLVRFRVASAAMRTAMGEGAEDVAMVGKQEAKALCAVLRDIFGPLPFRPVDVEPSLLTWNDGAVVKLAQGIYEGRAFDRMPVLADALEEAGCDNQELLSHCRSQHDHVLGCWVADLLLGKS
jgi:hypothetical protein